MDPYVLVAALVLTVVIAVVASFFARPRKAKTAGVFLCADYSSIKRSSKKSGRNNNQIVPDKDFDELLRIGIEKNKPMTLSIGGDDYVRRNIWS